MPAKRKKQWLDIVILEHRMLSLISIIKINNRWD